MSAGEDPPALHELVGAEARCAFPCRPYRVFKRQLEALDCAHATLDVMQEVGTKHAVAEPFIEASALAVPAHTGSTLLGLANVVCPHDRSVHGYVAQLICRCRVILRHRLPCRLASSQHHL